MRNLASIVAQLLVGLDLGAGGDFTLDPVLEGGGLGDFAGGFHAVHEGGGVVAFGVGEVAEVEGGFDGGVGGGEVEAAAGTGAGDVGGHAEGEFVGDGFVAQTLGVHCEGDLVTVGWFWELASGIWDRAMASGGEPQWLELLADLPVHHDIGNVTIRQRGWVCLKLVRCSVGLLATQEDARVRVHGRLALGHLLVQLPDDDRLWVVLQVLTHTGNVLDHGDV